MPKLTTFFSLLGLLPLTGTAVTMDQNRRPQYQPIAAGLLRGPYAPTYNETGIEHTKEALFLLNQQFTTARTGQRPLPAYFFTKLDAFLQKVPYANSKLRNEFSKLKQGAQELNATLVVPQLAADEFFDEESL